MLADPFSVSLHAVLREPPPAGGTASSTAAAPSGSSPSRSSARSTRARILAVARFPHQRRSPSASAPRASCRTARRAHSSRRSAAETGARAPDALARAAHAERRRVDVDLRLGGLRRDARGRAPRGARRAARLVLTGVATPRRFEWTPLYFKEVAIVGRTRSGSRRSKGAAARDGVLLRLLLPPGRSTCRRSLRTGSRSPAGARRSSPPAATRAGAARSRSCSIFETPSRSAGGVAETDTGVLPMSSLQARRRCARRVDPGSAAPAASATSPASPTSRPGCSRRSDPLGGPRARRHEPPRVRPAPTAATPSRSAAPRAEARSVLRAEAYARRRDAAPRASAVPRRRRSPSSSERAPTCRCSAPVESLPTWARQALRSVGRDLDRAPSDRVRGALVGDARPRGDRLGVRFEEADAALLKIAANAIGAALERAANEAALRAGEQRFRAMVDQAFDLVAELDEAGSLPLREPRATRRSSASTPRR